MTAQNWIPSTAGPTGNGPRVGLGFDIAPPPPADDGTQPGPSYGLVNGELVAYDARGAVIRHGTG